MGSAAVALAAVVSMLAISLGVALQVRTLQRNQEVNRNLSTHTGKRSNTNGLSLAEGLFQQGVVSWIAWPTSWSHSDLSGLPTGIRWNVSVSGNTEWIFLAQGKNGNPLFSYPGCNPELSTNIDTSIKPAPNNFIRIFENAQLPPNRQAGTILTPSMCPLAPLDAQLQFGNLPDHGIYHQEGGNYLPLTIDSALPRQARVVSSPLQVIHDNGRFNLDAVPAPAKPACVLEVDPADMNIVQGQTAKIHLATSYNVYTASGGNYPYDATGPYPKPFASYTSGQITITGTSGAVVGIFILPNNGSTATLTIEPPYPGGGYPSTVLPPGQALFSQEQITITVYGPGGSATCSDIVNVYPQPFCQITSAPQGNPVDPPNELDLGQTTTLTMTTSNAFNRPPQAASPIWTATLDGTSVGNNVPPDGDKIPSPGDNGGTKNETPSIIGTITYVGKVQGIHGSSASCSIAIRVYPDPACNLAVLHGNITVTQLDRVQMTTNNPLSPITSATFMGKPTGISGFSFNQPPNPFTPNLGRNDYYGQVLGLHGMTAICSTQTVAWQIPWCTLAPTRQNIDAGQTDSVTLGDNYGKTDPTTQNPIESATINSVSVSPGGGSINTGSLGQGVFTYSGKVTGVNNYFDAFKTVCSTSIYSYVDPHCNLTVMEDRFSTQPATIQIQTNAGQMFDTSHNPMHGEKLTIQGQTSQTFSGSSYTTTLTDYNDNGLGIQNVAVTGDVTGIGGTQYTCNANLQIYSYARPQCQVWVNPPSVLPYQGTAMYFQSNAGAMGDVTHNPMKSEWVGVQGITGPTHGSGSFFGFPVAVPGSAAGNYPVVGVATGIAGTAVGCTALNSLNVQPTCPYLNPYAPYNAQTAPVPFLGNLCIGPSGNRCPTYPYERGGFGGSPPYGYSTSYGNPALPANDYIWNNGLLTKTVGGEPLLCLPGHYCWWGSEYWARGQADPQFVAEVANPGSPGCVVDYIVVRYVGCFAPETAIRMADGSTLRADQIRGGMLLWNPVRKSAMRVFKVVAGPEKPGMMELGYGSKHVHVTTKHPVLTRRGVKQARLVTLQDEILGVDRKFHRVTVARQLPAKKGQRVWNFEVDVASTDPADHLLESDGIITGDLNLQLRLERQLSQNTKRFGQKGGKALLTVKEL